MEYLEYKNGKYTISKDVFTSKNSDNVQGVYSLRNPIYPCFDLNVSTNKEEWITRISIDTVVWVKNTLISFSSTYEHYSQFNTVILNEYLLDFDKKVAEFKENVNIKALKKSIK